MNLKEILGFGKPAQPTGPNHTAVQGWLPVADIHDNCLVRTDGKFVAALRVSPINLSLRREREQLRLVSGLFGALNGLGMQVQILSTYRPVDLDGYLQGLQARLMDVPKVRRRYLLAYYRWSASMVANGEVLERRYYVLLISDGPDTEANRRELTDRATAFAQALASAELEARVLDDRGLVEMCWLWSHPHLAAFEPAPDVNTVATTLFAPRGGDK